MKKYILGRWICTCSQEQDQKMSPRVFQWLFNVEERRSTLFYENSEVKNQNKQGQERNVISVGDLSISREVHKVF